MAADQAVVQRSYNAFAVRVLGDSSSERRVVPANEAAEGILCIEMRIRLYPGGLMSGLLSRLIKVHLTVKANVLNRIITSAALSRAKPPFVDRMLGAWKYGCTM